MTHNETRRAADEVLFTCGFAGVPIVADALTTISGSVRNTATLLEVLVRGENAPAAGPDPPDA